MFLPNDVWWCCCELGWLCQDQSFLTKEKHLKVSNFLRISRYTLYVYTTVTIWLLHLFCLANQHGFRNKMERKHGKAASRIYNDWTVGFAVRQDTNPNTNKYMLGGVVCLIFAILLPTTHNYKLCSWFVEYWVVLLDFGEYEGGSVLRTSGAKWHSCPGLWQLTLTHCPILWHFTLTYCRSQP